MSRFKTFNSTGVAPDGRLYAGDLNAIQDMKADLSNFSQSVDVAQVSIGEAGLQLQRFGTLEARMTGAMRVDGILRGLGGLFAGTFTTTQRNAIPAGFRPTGVIIFNSTVGRLEVNTGTDAVPVWSGVGAGITPPDIPPGQGLLPAGAFVPYGGAVAPTGFLLCDGQKYLQSAYPTLYAAISTAWNTGGELGTEFRVPDFKGRSPFGLDASQTEFNAIGKKGGAKVMPPEGMPVHAHLVNSHSHGGGYHDHGGTYGVGDHGHGVGDPGHTHGPVDGVNNFAVGVGSDAASGTARRSPVGWHGNTGASGTGIWIGAAGAHSHGIPPQWTVSAEAPGTDNRGGQAGVTQPHLPPHGVCNFIIKT